MVTTRNSVVQNALKIHLIVQVSKPCRKAAAIVETGKRYGYLDWLSGIC